MLLRNQARKSLHQGFSTNYQITLVRGGCGVWTHCQIWTGRRRGESGDWGERLIAGQICQLISTLICTASLTKLTTALSTDPKAKSFCGKCYNNITYCLSWVRKMQPAVHAKVGQFDEVIQAKSKGHPSKKWFLSLIMILMTGVQNLLESMKSAVKSNSLDLSNVV